MGVFDDILPERENYERSEKRLPIAVYPGAVGFGVLSARAELFEVGEQLSARERQARWDRDHDHENPTNHCNLRPPVISNEQF